MWAYVLKRLLLMIPTLFGILLITFVVIQFVPGGPVEQMVAQFQGFESGGEGPAAAEAGYRGRQGVDAVRVEEIKKLYGFDKPPHERFVQMIGQFARFDLGKSAIGRMARIVAALERFDEEVLRKRESHPLLPPPSLHCSMIQGGSGLSTYAAECVAQVERRTVPGESEAQVVAEIRRVIADAGEAADVAVSLTRSPLACDPESPVARAVRAATGDVTGSAPEEVGVGYWMDAAIFADAGIPAVDYGPTGAGAHEAVEWVDLESVVTTARVLAGAARRFLG